MNQCWCSLQLAPAHRETGLYVSFLDVSNDLLGYRGTAIDGFERGQEAGVRAVGTGHTELLVDVTSGKWSGTAVVQEHGQQAGLDAAAAVGGQLIELG